MNDSDLYTLAQKLKSDPRFKRAAGGTADISSLADDPEIRKAVAELTGGGDPEVLARQLLAGKDGDKIRLILETLKK